MTPHRPRRGAFSRRASAALCAALLIGSTWGLERFTHGFEVWTYEGRRALAIEAGALRAPALALRRAHGSAAPAPWSAAEVPAATLVDFIYTRCESVCRALGSEFHRMQARLLALPRDEGVRLLSVSFDTGYDGVAQLQSYARRHRADSRLWAVTVPASADESRALLRALGVVVIPDGQGGFVHNGSIHLLDGDGTLRGVFALDEWEQALDAARRLAATRRGAR